MINNLFNNLPQDLSDEVFDDLLKTENVRIERIISNGHSSPSSGWYDQVENEWVCVIQGYGVLEFEDGQIIRLQAGDSFNILAKRKHKVVETASEQPTIWLAVFYK